LKDNSKLRFLMLNWRDPENPLAGGAERVTLGYWRALAEAGHEAWWFANAFPGAAPASRIDGVEIRRQSRTGLSIAAAFRWVRSQPRFDLVVDQHHGIPWFAPWWCGTRCVACIHEVLGPIWSSFYPWPADALGRFQERWTHWLYRRVPFWTACGATERDLRKHGVRDIHRIPYGVHTRALQELPLKPAAPPVRLIVVSRLAPNKQIDQAIDAALLLRDDGLPCELRVVGDGAERARLEAHAASRGAGGSVRFLGALSESDKNRELRDAHVLVHTWRARDGDSTSSRPTPWAPQRLCIPWAGWWIRLSTTKPVLSPGGNPPKPWAIV